MWDAVYGLNITSHFKVNSPEYNLPHASIDPTTHTTIVTVICTADAWGQNIPRLMDYALYPRH